MGVAVEADLGELVGEVRHGVELVGDVVPVGRLVEGAVDDGEVLDLADHAEPAQPVALFFAELLAGPLQGGGGHRVHGFERVVAGGVLVVVALDHGAVHRADHFEAAAGVGVVADDVAHADVAVTPCCGRPRGPPQGPRGWRGCHRRERSAWVAKGGGEIGAGWR